MFLFNSGYFSEVPSLSCSINFIFGLNLLVSLGINELDL